jgi:teichuronic acid exporter
MACSATSATVPLARVVAMAFQLASSIVLSRHLGAHDYGGVGFALIFINYLTQFHDLGLNTASVQAKTLVDDALATGFWMKAALGAAMCGIAMLAAPAAGWFFDEPAVSAAMRVLSLNFVIGALAFIPTTLLPRALDYRAISMAQILSTIASGIVAIGLALNGAGYWSIVLGNVAATLTLVVCMNVASPHRVDFSFDVGHARSLAQYGLSLFGSGLVIFALFNADNFLIGLTGGADALGYYTIAFSWGAMIAVTMSIVVNSVLFPTFSTCANETRRSERRNVVLASSRVDGSSIASPDIGGRARRARAFRRAGRRASTILAADLVTPLLTVDAVD